MLSQNCFLFNTYLSSLTGTTINQFEVQFSRMTFNASDVLFVHVTCYVIYFLLVNNVFAEFQLVFDFLISLLLV